jgi:homoserine kinase type II
MAVYTVLRRKTLETLTEAYGLGELSAFSGVPAGSVNTYYRLESSKGNFFLKIDEVKSEPEVRQEIDLLAFLRTHRIPCPKPIADQNGQLIRERNGKALSVYAALSGKARTESEITTEHLSAVGKVLASLHLAGQGYKGSLENRFSFGRIRALYLHMRETMPAHLKQVKHTLDDEFAHHEEYLEERLPKGIVHGDIFADNLLFHGKKVVGLLDFEAACQGKFITDLATAVNALCFTDGEFELERFNALVKGYQDVRGLSLVEWDAFPNELRFSALRFTVTRLKDFYFRSTDHEVRVRKDFQDFLDRLHVLRRERAGGMDKLLLAMATGYDYRKYQKVP